MEADDENNSNQDLDSMEDLDDGGAPDSEGMDVAADDLDGDCFNLKLG